MAAEETFPPEWSDDQRMTVLFAAFRDKSLNSHSWNQKMNFWMTLITDKFKQSNECTVNVEELTLRFERKGKTPKCLELVIQEMTRLQKLKSITDIQASQPGWVSWGMNVVKKPISWSLGLISGSQSTTETIFYFPDLLQDKCSKLLERHYNGVEFDSTDHIWEISILKEKHKDLFNNDYDIVMQQLEADRKVLLTRTKNNDTIVKFCKQNEKAVETVQESDLNLYRMSKVQKDLEKQIETLSEKCDSHTEDAKMYIKEGKKTMALQCLRKRKSVEKSIDKKSNSLGILHDMLAKIQEAVNNEMVVNAYESGVAALKATRKDLNIGKVDNVMDSMQELFEDQEEISLAMSLGDITLNDSTVAEELDALLLEDDDSTNFGAGVKSNTQGKVQKFPDVPTSSPASKSKGSNYFKVADL